jgi:hypothetical protein
VRTAVCGIANGSVQQCSAVRQCAAVCGSCGSAGGSLCLFVFNCIRLNLS